MVIKQSISSLLLFLLLMSASDWALAYVVGDIRVEGLQRVSAGSVFNSVPINVGDDITAEQIRQIIREIFKTGFFKDVSVGRDGNVLVINVSERPSIDGIEIEGNKAIETEALLQGLEGSGLAEGQIFKQVTLEHIQVDLERQYVSQGRYGANIETEVIDLPRNRVSLKIDVTEGEVAGIKHINIVGNSIYDDERLSDLFELKTTGWLSWMSSDDKYAREKLTGDIDTLESYYLDSGYIQFSIDSTQVSVTPDREAVYITVNVIEGEKFAVGEVDLSGDIVLPEQQLRPFIFVKTGQTFSQALVTSTEEWLTKRLGNEGNHVRSQFVNGCFVLTELPLMPYRRPQSSKPNVWVLSKGGHHASECWSTDVWVVRLSFESEMGA